MSLELLARDAALEQDPGLIDAKTVSNSMKVREVQAWRFRFPKDTARVNTELDLFRRAEPNNPVTCDDELMLWRRWFPDFKFRPQDDVVTIR